MTAQKIAIQVSPDATVFCLDARPDTITGVRAPLSLMFGFDAKQPIVTLFSDGRVVVDEKWQADDAARAFWLAVQKLAPQFIAPGGVDPHAPATNQAQQELQL